MLDYERQYTTPWIKVMKAVNS
uniref:Uncharacterized protein n=1 Tax=Arundo donax TaxID=35708 RepID=A0A0A8ZSQ6_ARUDO